MSRLFSVRIGARLALAFGVVLVLLAVLSGTALLAIQRLSSSADVLYTQRTEALVALAQVDALLGRSRMLVMDMLLDPGTANVQRRSTALRANIDLVPLAWARYRAADPAPHADRLAQWQAFERLLDAYLKQGLAPAAAAASEGRYDDTVAAYSDHIGPMSPQVETIMAELTASEVAQAGGEFEQVQQVAQAARATVLAGAALALLLGAWLAWAITRSVTQPLRHAVAVANAIAHGDLRPPPLARGRDESAELLRALAGMCAQLRQVVEQVREASEAVAHGANEVTAGTADLSQRTEQQATKLEATRATVASLLQLAGEGRGSAQEATGLAQQASQTAQSGGAAVHQVVQRMSAIQTSSQRIGDIIGVIDGIAFQTNILALNAAVEAARAGEQGRGFAVVAGEVRTLAQRSTQAAREIKALIHDSLAQVASGATQVTEAGERVGGIVAQVDQVRALIDDLHRASDQQNLAVQQIASTVGMLDQTTQSNAALAEQSMASADSLRQQAQRLITLVATFELGHERPLLALSART